MHVSISVAVTQNNGAGVSKGQMFADPTPEEIATAILIVLRGTIPSKHLIETLEFLAMKASNETPQ